jgi:hypothetical protein
MVVDGEATEAPPAITPLSVNSAANCLNATAGLRFGNNLFHSGRQGIANIPLD